MDPDIERLRRIADDLDAAKADWLATRERLYAERAKIVRRLRADKGWSLGQLADKLGVSRTRVQQYEAGK